MFAIPYLFKEGDFMFSNIVVRDDFKDDIVDISGRRFSDFGMMWGKLSKLIGIDLDTLFMYDDWYILNDEFYYFKEHCIFEELFMSELAYECKIKCVEFKLAFDEGNLGVISKLYRTKDKQYYMYSDFCDNYFNHIPADSNVFKLASSIAFGEENAQVLMNEIFGLVSFDIFSGQRDREEYNLFFECDNNSVRLAPLCDNGAVFTESLVYSCPFGKFSLFDDYEYKVYRNNLLRIVSFNKNLFDKLAFLLDVNIDEILRRTIDKYRVIINNEYISYVLSYFDNRKKAVESTLKLSKNNNR